ncbi:hypothetical protein JW897_16670 [Chromobacterium alkanivorans]|uniref:hypothetical protein n=1 Tax=Chromobacterium alkanivorans TaxID=1071719 RepID=UPI0019686A6D|nr:hypothetical protein [Chromobacterium alkanivorans]MBN3005372.1 hypothetical protein [Chromobacterium alkanivorans]
MPFKARDFEHPLYHEDMLKRMSWMDKVASYILAIYWTRAEGQDTNRKTKVDGFKVKNRQLESHLDCVAVMEVEGKWYIAANRLSISDVDVRLTDMSLCRSTSNFVDNYRFGYIYSDFELVQNYDNFMHAEMKILKRLHELGKLKVRMHIGVSKPCCPRCKKVLDDWQIEYTSFHDVSPNDNTWIDPGVGHPADESNTIRDLFL